MSGKINVMGWLNEKGSRAASVRQEFREELPVLDVGFPLLGIKRMVSIWAISKRFKNGVMHISKTWEIDQSCSRKICRVVRFCEPGEMSMNPHIHIPHVKVRTIVFFPFRTALDQIQWIYITLLQKVEREPGLTFWCNQTKNSGMRLCEWTASRISAKSPKIPTSNDKSDVSKPPNFNRSSGVGVDFMQW